MCLLHIQHIIFTFAFPRVIFLIKKISNQKNKNIHRESTHESVQKSERNCHCLGCVPSICGSDSESGRRKIEVSFVFGLY